MFNKDLEKVGNLICEARAILEEVMDDTDWSDNEDQQDVLENILDNIQSAEGQFDWYKEDWIE